jgi:hypothetical protein
MEGVWIQGILTEVISKISETHVEAPLEEKKVRTLQSKSVKKRMPD